MQSRDPERLVGSIPLFTDIGRESVALVASLLRFQQYKARQVVVWEGEPAGALFLVVSGYYKAVTTGGEGNEVLLSVMGPGEVLGELSVLDGKPRSASVAAIEPGELATIDRPALLELLNRTPGLAIKLLDVLVQRLRQLTIRCEAMSSDDVERRLARALLLLARRHGQPHEGAVRIPVRLSQQDLGSMVGATRESVNKQLRAWSKRGVLRHEQGRVLISDLAALHGATE